MGVLADYLKSEVEQLRAEVTNRKQELDDWLGALAKLYEQLATWLQEADGGLGVIGVSDTTPSPGATPLGLRHLAPDHQHGGANGLRIP